MIYKKIINDNLLVLFKSLIGSDIQSIYSNGLIVYKDHIESLLFIIRLNNKSWLNIRNWARETPNDSDYYEFNITNSEFPEELNYDEIHNSIIFPCSKIDLNHTRILSIDIYSRHEFYGDEEFFYDVVLLFNCNRKFKFMISSGERVDELLVYSDKVKVINKHVNSLKLRASL